MLVKTQDGNIRNLDSYSKLSPVTTGAKAGNAFTATLNVGQPEVVDDTGLAVYAVIVAATINP